MAENHPKNIDPRPKRRRDKNNPYEIFTVGIETDCPRYFVRFTDSICVEHCIEIKKELFDLFDQFELDDISFFNEVDRHIEQSELSEAMLEQRVFQPLCSVEDEVYHSLQMQAVRTQISCLPDIQKRRLQMYFFEGLTYEEIAAMEGCTVMPVKRSIDRALRKIKSFFENKG